MEIKYILDGAMTENQQKAVRIIDSICFAGDPNEPEAEFDINTLMR